MPQQDCEKHTPGPWQVRGIGADAWAVYDRFTVRRVALVGSRREPDARLIAAAPTLLEAVKAAVDYHCSARGTEEELIRQLWAAYNAAVDLNQGG